jgi:hypothetical protein
LLSCRSCIFFFFFLVKALWGRGVSLTLFPRGAAGPLLQAGIAQGCDKSIGNLLYTVATKYPANALKHRPALCNYIITNRIKTVPQLEAAFAFLALVGPDSYNEVEFEEKCGVGMGHSLHQIFSG